MIRSPIEVFPNNTTIDLYGHPSSYTGSMRMQTTGEIVKHICIVSSLNLQKTETIKKDYTTNLYNDSVFTFSNWISPITEKWKNVSVLWKANMFSDECTKLYGNKTIRDYNTDSKGFYIKTDYDTGIKGDSEKSSVTTPKDSQYNYIIYNIKINGQTKVVTPLHYCVVTTEGEKTVETWETRLYCSAISLSESDKNNTIVELYTNCTESETFNFYTASLPVVTFNVPSEINNFAHTFSATYSQAENILPKYFIFNLYNSRDKLVQTSGKIYSSNINYAVDNLLNGDYYIELYVYNQKDVEVYQKRDFTVALPDTSLGYVLNLSFDENQGCANITWGNTYRKSKGKTTNTFTYEQTPWNNQYKNVVMPANSKITYDEMNNTALSLNPSSAILYSGIIQGGKILDFNFSHNYYDSSEGLGVFSIYTNLDKIIAKIEMYDSTRTRTTVREKVIANLLQQNQSCFNNSLIPANERTNKYMLQNDAIWTTDNTYFIVNEDTDIQYFNYHYKINIIPSLAINNVFNNNDTNEGIYIYLVNDIDGGN